MIKPVVTLLSTNRDIFDWDRNSISDIDKGAVEHKAFMQFVQSIQ